MIDIRLKLSFRSHPKTKKLKRNIGSDGVLCLIWLFSWAAENKPNGDLSGMDIDDIEIAADWEGAHGEFVAAIIKVGFLDGDEGAYVLHDWFEHNPWAAGATARSEKARWLATCKHHGKEKAAELMPEYAARMINAASSKEITSKNPASSMQHACDAHASSMQDSENSSAPSPSPSPSPLPKEVNPFVASKLTTPPCPHSEILAAYAEALPELPQPRIWDGAREKGLTSRWRWVISDLQAHGKPHDSAAGIAFFRRMFGYIRESDFLMGRGNSAWSADLGWIVKAENFAKIIQGNYENKGRAAA